MLDYPYLAPELPMELRAPTDGSPPDNPPRVALVALWIAITVAALSAGLAGYCLLLALEDAQKNTQPAEVRHVDRGSAAAD